MIELKREAREMIDEALREANREHELFHSLHEGYAVLLEEFEEAMCEVEKIEILKGGLWNLTKRDDVDEAMKEADKIVKYAVAAIAELAQVGAMAEKIIKSKETWK